MKKKRTTPAKNTVDRREEGPCTHGKLKDELRRSARKRRREERAKRREDSRERKRWSKASSPHCGIRPENAVALSHKAKGSIDGEGDAKLNERGKVGVSKENTPAEIGTVRIDDMTEEAVTTGHTSPPHKKKRKHIGTKRTRKPKTTSSHFEAESEAPPKPKGGAGGVRVQKSNSTETVANTADQTVIIPKSRSVKPRPPKIKAPRIKKTKKQNATSPQAHTRTKPFEIITEHITQETRAKRVKKSKSTSSHFSIGAGRPPVTRKTKSEKSKSTSASPYFDIKPKDALGEILMSQIDDPSKTITGGAEQQQASISKPRGAHTRAKIASYIEQSEEGPEGKQKKKWKTKEGAASVEKQERKERKKTVRRVQAGISNAIWPPLSSDRFGLIQEELKGDAFHIIVGTTFLNRTRGSVAIPLLRQFLRDYPTPHALSLASITKISTFLRPLGLYNIRATRLHNLATTWLATPPIFGQATKKYNYPPRNTKPFPSSLLPNNGVEQGRCWEIAHLPGVGAYALDSWRIFCRDEFRRAAGERVEIGQEEWRSVVPMDKELRVYVRWMWAKEGLRWKEPGDIQQTSLSSPFFERMANTRPG